MPSGNRSSFGSRSASARKDEDEDEAEDAFQNRCVGAVKPAGWPQLYFDGSCRNNPGQGAIGAIIKSSNGTVHASLSRRMEGTVTNNQVEYAACIVGLERACRFPLARLRVRGDSEVVIKQVTGDYRTRDRQLRKARDLVRSLLTEFEAYDIAHVPRENNTEAHRLARSAATW